MGEMVKDVHLTGRDLMTMVQLRPEDVGPYVLVPGPRERMEALVARIEDPIKNFSFMEYTMFTGGFSGTRVTAINGGRFAADTAITTEILCHARPKIMVRLGSCGALREDISIGDLVVAETARRGEGVTPYYVDPDYETRADAGLTEALVEVAGDGRRLHRGRVWSTDAILRETREKVGEAVADGAIAVDMVTSTFLTLCGLFGIPAAAILAVSDNVITGEMGFMNPDYYMAEAALLDIGLGLVRTLEEGGPS